MSPLVTRPMVALPKGQHARLDVAIFLFSLLASMPLNLRALLTEGVVPAGDGRDSIIRLCPGLLLPTTGAIMPCMVDLVLVSVETSGALTDFGKALLRELPI